MHVHPKASGHEAHGAHLTSGTRKKAAHNPDEVGPVKDHFSEGRQQENRRQPPPQNQPPEPEPAAFAAHEATVETQQQESHALAARQAELALNSLLKEAAPDANQSVQAASDHRDEVKDPSLDDLLAMMRGKP